MTTSTSKDKRLARKKYLAEYRIRNKERISSNERQRYRTKRDEILQKAKIKRNTDSHRIMARRFQAKHRRKIRFLCLLYYSKGTMCCKCCSESHRAFLTIDHIIPVGHRHDEKYKERRELYRWLVSHNFPEGYQVLCMNCNYGRWQNGGLCPHLIIEINN